MADDPPVGPATPAPGNDPPAGSRFRDFVKTYHTFISSFVIGGAGLIATTIYQSKQQLISTRQADAQIEISRQNNDNQWKITRAEILSKNLAVLATGGPDHVDQRYGVLLSLTREKIIDPELAVSYALDLGTYNADYMESVLSNVAGKSYLQLAHNYLPSCTQRYGIARNTPTCKKTDAVVERSQAIAELIAEELSSGSNIALTLLSDERQVQSQLRRLSGLFAPYLTSLYEKRQYAEMERFAAGPTGARAIASMAFAADRTGEMVSDDDLDQREKLHQAQRAWLEGYVLGRSCDPECKGRFADVLLTDEAPTGGAFDGLFHKLFERPDPEITPTVGRMHARFLWCQIEPANAAHVRDRVLVPGAAAALAEKPSPATAERIDDLVGLLALLPEPAAGSPQAAAFQSVAEGVRKGHPERWQRSYLKRRADADRQRKNPPPALKGANFCAAQGSAEVLPTDEEP